MRVRVDGVVVELTRVMKVDRYKTHDIELVVDRMTINQKESNLKRLKESMVAAMYQGDNTLVMVTAADTTNLAILAAI